MYLSIWFSTLSFSSVTWPRGPPRAGCKSSHDGTTNSFTGIRHCSRENSRHLTWMSAHEPNGRKPLPELWWKGVLFEYWCMACRFSVMENRIPPVICSSQCIGLLPLVPCLWPWGCTLGLWDPTLAAEMWGPW